MVCQKGVFDVPFVFLYEIFRGFARMYGRMQYADYLVSYALQTLNRCLLKVAANEALTDKDERLFLEQIAHLESIWQMLQWSVGKVVHEQASERLREISGLVPAPNPELQAAAQLLEYSHDKVQSTLVAVAAQASLPELAPWLERRERLSTLLQEESTCWRDYLPLRRVPEAELVEHGMARAYIKAEKLSRRLDAASNADQEPAGPKRLVRTHRWSGHAANHLDLIRGVLDDSARAQRWHLRRLHGKVEQQLGLELFTRRAVEIEMKAKARHRLELLLATQRRHLDKQRRKLTEGAFLLSPEDYVAQAAGCVEELGLQRITLLPVDTGEQA
jgi:hypothetical protein